MRYVIVDQDGRSGEYLDSFHDVVLAMQEIRREDLEFADQLMVLTYGAEGQRVGEPIDASHVPYFLAVNAAVNRSSSAAETQREAAYA
jgi:hypothetical protein